MKTIAVTGGIGAGKSMVCKILRCLGFDVFDCDDKAKTIMDSDLELMQSIHLKIHPSVIVSEKGNLRIDRKKLASIVFSDSEKLEILNQLVHCKVFDLFKTEANIHCDKGDKLFFFETAILYESGMDRFADEIWIVSAPKEIRILRLENRGLSTDESVKRMDSQNINFSVNAKNREIVNDGLKPVLPQVLKLLNQL